MQLAQNFPEVNVVGLGAQDNLAQANDFVARTGTGNGEITMVWDPSFESWRAFGIRSQPYWLLFGRDGELLFSQPGSIDFDAVRSAL